MNAARVCSSRLETCGGGAGIVCGHQHSATRVAEYKSERLPRRRDGEPNRSVLPSTDFRRRLQRLAVRLVPVLRLVALVGCSGDRIGEERKPSIAGPRLRTIDSLVLSEKGGVFVSKPNDILAISDSRVLVSDAAVGRVLEYAADGDLRRTIGGRGRGPGEFASPGWMSLVGDSLLLVQNSPALRIEAFDLRSGEWRWGRRFTAKTTTGLASRDGVVLLGLLDATRHSSFVEFPDTLSELVARGQLPYDAHDDPLLTDAFRLTQLAVHGSRIAQAFEVSNWLFVFGPGPADVDSFHIAVARRKGAPTRLLPLLRTNQSLGMKAVNHVSQPIALGWLDSERVGVVTVDPDRTSPRYRGKAFVSVVNIRRREACVDGALDVPSDPAPVATFRGDTLLVLYQDVSSTGAAETIVKRLHVDLTSCEWRTTQ